MGPLSEILKRWLGTTSNLDEQAKIDSLPKFDQARWYVNKISARKGGATFNPIKAGSVVFAAINPNIDTFINRINSYTEKLLQNTNLTPPDCFAELNNTTLDQFFTDEKGMYIPFSTIHEFILSCNKLFEVIDKQRNLKSRDIDYSVRLMSKCFSSIRNVCVAVETVGQ